MPAEEQPNVVFVLGGPGSGKGTQSAKIVEHYGFVHLSAGELLRGEVRSGSENGNMINKLMKEGAIVPAEITVGLLKAAILKNFKEQHKKYFLVDGFPRNYDNNRCWVAEMPPEIVNTRFVLFMDCPREEMLKRLMDRSKVSGRVDDNIDTINARFDTFLSQSMPVVDEYEKKGMVYKVDATSDPETVFGRVKAIFDKEFPDAH